MNVLYHSIIIALILASSILWGIIGVIGICVIAVFTIGMIEDEYKPTVVLSLIVAIIIGGFFTGENEELSTTPTQVCEYYLKVVDTTSTRVVYHESGMLLIDYDTIPVIKNSSIDTIKNNCYEVK